MPRSAKSPSTSIISKMRTRRPAISYLWTCYSHKTDKDLILESHQELMHWLLFLEFDSAIKSFWIPVQNEVYSDQRGGRGVRPDAIATNVYGRQEWHEVKAGWLDEEALPSDQLRIQREIAAANGAIHRVFDDGTRSPYLYKIPCLMRLCCFVALCRHLHHVPQIEQQVLAYTQAEREGNLQGLLQAFPAYEPVYLVGVLSRLFISNEVSIELTEQTPCLTTGWSSYEAS